MDEDFDDEEPRWDRVKVLAAWAVGVALMALLIGGGVEQLALALSLPPPLVAQSEDSATPTAEGAPSFRNIDYGEVGVLKRPGSLFPAKK